MQDRGGEIDKGSTKEYKGRTDNNSPTGPKEAVLVATLLLLYLYDRQKDSKVEGSSPPIPLSSQSWPEKDVIPCSINKLSWNLYKKVRQLAIGILLVPF